MFQQIFITEITTSELLVCRGCLATDARLYDMRQNRLMEAYSSLLNTDVQITDDLPHYLCNYCTALLLKYEVFKMKCINSQTLLKKAISSSLELTLENIKQLERPTHFRQSYIQIIDIDDTNPEANNNANNVAEPVKEEFDDEPLKKEFDRKDVVDNTTDNSNVEINDNSDDKVNSILKKTLISDNNESKVNAITTRKRKIKTVSKKQTKMKLEVLQSELKTNLLKNNDLLAKTINDDDYENTDEVNKISSDSDDEVTIRDLKIISKESKCKTKTPNNTARVKWVMKKKTKGKPNVNKKTKEYVSKVYNMDEVDLSKEEQLKEVEDRKTSEIYLQAEYKCEFCFKGFRLKESFNSHMMLHDDRSGKYVCDICHCHFITTKRLNKHKSTHRKKFTCKHDACEYVTKHLSQAREHYKWHGGVKEICKHCGKGCGGQTSYYHHLKLYHPTSDDLIRCEICGTSCNGPLGFLMHEKRTHKEMYSPECYCSGCNTQFYCSDAFKAHQGADGLCITTHKYCVRCGMSFETEQLLKEHEIEQRKPRTMFKCEVNQYILKQHYLNKHSTENPFKCTQCPKSFRSVKNLQLHTRIHTGERPHPCSHCPSTFRSVTNLRRHELVHTDARPHSCEICGKAFKTKADCKAHVQTVHMKICRPRVRRKNKKTE